MEMKEISAKTVDEAVEVALKELNAEREEVEIEIVTRGKAGFLGMGAELACVRVKKLDDAAGAARISMEILDKLLTSTGVTASALLRDAHNAETEGPVIDIEGDDAGLLIGRRGETLQALQFLVNIIARASISEPTRISVDVERYLQRRDQTLKELAQKVADRVATSGRGVSLEPMSPRERRVIHITLADNTEVSTYSQGIGPDRKVFIDPQ